MTTRTKTIRYAFPLYTAQIANNVLTNLSQIVVAIPETIIAFKSVVVRWDYRTCYGTGIPAAMVFTTNTKFKLGTAAYSADTNYVLPTAIPNIAPAENYSFYSQTDITSYFTSNWSGTSMTADLQVLRSTTGTGPPAFNNISAELIITYDYDDTSATKIKTIYLPLTTMTGTLPTSKPATAQCVFPALDTYLTEASKSYKGAFIQFEGNEAGVASTTNFSASLSIDSAIQTTGTVISTLASDTYDILRFNCFSGSMSFDTATTHSLYYWASAARYQHPSAHLVVTYEYNEAATSTVFNSICVAPIATSQFGLSTSSYGRTSVDFYIEEPGTITAQSSSLNMLWNAIERLYAYYYYRIGSSTSGSWSTLADGEVATNLVGPNSQNFIPTLSLNRGKNTLDFDLFHPLDSAPMSARALINIDISLSSCWIINYTSGKSAQGTGAHNHTIFNSVLDHYAWPGNYIYGFEVTGKSLIKIADPYYYFNSSMFTMNFVAARADANESMPRPYATLSKFSSEGAGNFRINNQYSTIMDLSFMSIRRFNSDVTDISKKFKDDPTTGKYDLSLTRSLAIMGSFNPSASPWGLEVIGLDMNYTYHSNTFSVTGSVAGSAGGTVELQLLRTADDKKLATTSSIGNGDYSFTWYDNTEKVYVVARESGVLLGRSDDDYAV
jgi:hypothetical protein